MIEHFPDDDGDEARESPAIALLTVFEGDSHGVVSSCLNSNTPNTNSNDESRSHTEQRGKGRRAEQLQRDGMDWNKEASPG